MSDSPVQMPKPVFLASDGTGDTAEQMFRAAFRQFRGSLIHVRRFPAIARVEQLETVFRKAKREGALVVTTLVQRDLREAAVVYAESSNVCHTDLIGPLIGDLENYLGSEAAGVAGLMHSADEHYFRRIEAVEYTVKADDGKVPNMLMKADIILTGVSRTSKTPLSTFLAHKGYKVGNIPLVLDRPPPAQLFKVNQRRVVALTISPQALQGIRQSRLKTLRMGKEVDYGDMDYILAELEYANDLFRANPLWPVIDVTNKAIEETAAQILGEYRERGFDVPLGDTGQL